MPHTCTKISGLTNLIRGAYCKAGVSSREGGGASLSQCANRTKINRTNNTHKGTLQAHGYRITRSDFTEQKLFSSADFAVVET